MDPCSSGKGYVSPRESSSTASRAIRLTVSRFSANRFSHASSSARASRIWNAMASCSSRGSAPTWARAFSRRVVMLSVSAKGCYGADGLVRGLAADPCLADDLLLRPGVPHHQQRAGNEDRRIGPDDDADE